MTTTTTDLNEALALLVDKGGYTSDDLEPLPAWLKRGDDVLVFELADLGVVMSGRYPLYWTMPWERDRETPRQAPDTDQTGLGWRYVPALRVTVETVEGRVMDTKHEYIVSIKVAVAEDIEDVYDVLEACSAVVSYSEMAEWNIAEMEAEEAARKASPKPAVRRLVKRPVKAAPVQETPVAQPRRNQQLRLPLSLLDRIKAEAARRRVSKAFIIESIVVEALPEYERQALNV